MVINELINQATAAGLVLTVDGDKLKYEGQRTPAAVGILQQIAQRKNEVIAALAPVVVAPEPPAAPWRITYCSSDDLRAHVERKNADARPTLPSDQAVTDLPTLAAALEVQRTLAQYRTRCGRGENGFYVIGD